jgi:hypothetical protein
MPWPVSAEHSRMINYPLILLVCTLNSFVVELPLPRAGAGLDRLISQPASLSSASLGTTRSWPCARAKGERNPSQTARAMLQSSLSGAQGARARARVIHRGAPTWRARAVTTRSAHALVRLRAAAPIFRDACDARAHTRSARPL